MFFGQRQFLYTSESVSDGHPDKVCDQIADALLDAHLTQDPKAHVAIEVLVTKNFVLLAGEVLSAHPLSSDETEAITRQTIRDIGYEEPGFHWQNCIVENRIHTQSPELTGTASGRGANDQGMMLGYATSETRELMPAGVYYAQRVLEALSYSRKIGAIPQLKPDAKCQITVQYQNGKPYRLEKFLLSHQHEEGITPAKLKKLILPIVEKVIPPQLMPPPERWLINPAGKFVIGGPEADTGLTGRKIIADTYGAMVPHGGGAFSGKDSSKIDRSAAYMARYVAKNVVAAGLSERCMVQLSYAIGVAEPISLMVEMFGTEIVDPSILVTTLQEILSFTPKAIRRHLNLNRPIYKKTASFGHFGRESGADGVLFPWEQLDLAQELRQVFQI